METRTTFQTINDQPNMPEDFPLKCKRFLCWSAQKRANNSVPMAPAALLVARNQPEVFTA